MTGRKVAQAIRIAVPLFLAATCCAATSGAWWMDLGFGGGEASVVLFAITTIALLLSLPLALPGIIVSDGLTVHLGIPAILLAYAANSVLWALVILKARDYRRRRASQLDDSQDEA